MTNHPNRGLDLTIVAARIRRVRENVIQYDLTSREPDGSGTTGTLHANGYATFRGEHTGSGGAPQMPGAARTLWRATDTAMIAAFRRIYPNAHVEIA